MPPYRFVFHSSDATASKSDDTLKWLKERRNLEMFDALQKHQFYFWWEQDMLPQGPSLQVLKDHAFANPQDVPQRRQDADNLSIATIRSWQDLIDNHISPRYCENSRMQVVAVDIPGIKAGARALNLCNFWPKVGGQAWSTSIKALARELRQRPKLGKSPIAIYVAFDFIDGHEPALPASVLDPNRNNQEPLMLKIEGPPELRTYYQRRRREQLRKLKAEESSRPGPTKRSASPVPAAAQQTRALQRQRSPRGSQAAPYDPSDFYTSRGLPPPTWLRPQQPQQATGASISARAPPISTSGTRDNPMEIKEEEDDNGGDLGDPMDTDKPAPKVKSESASPSPRPASASQASASVPPAASAARPAISLEIFESLPEDEKRKYWDFLHRQGR